MESLESSYTESGPIENVIQGDLWREVIKPKFAGKTVLPLGFNFDDYETAWELGTHTGVYKLGAGYLQILSLPPTFRSALENIFLVLLIHSGDRVLGNQKVFRKVIEEFKFLEKVGIPVKTSEGVTQVYFALELVFGDNLGANGILGFVESFRANFYCTICHVEYSAARTLTRAIAAKMRNIENYESDLSKNDESKTGVKERCVFNEVESFHCARNFHLDLMHDQDEGTVKYVMYGIIKYLFDKKRFDIDQLNELIQGFYYGAEEKNRLPSITYDDLCKSKRLRISASEARCLVRYFGLMAGHLVKEEDREVWDLYLKARSVMDFVTAPVVFAEDLSRLRDLIEEHHTLFQRIFETHLRPKFHLMLHEPDVMKLLGPLEFLSCYRTESKHTEGKEIARRSNNRVNLPFTIAKRHQLKLAFRLLCRRGFNVRFKFSKLRYQHVEKLPNFAKFRTAIPPEKIAEWSTAKWVEINGTKYCLEYVVLVSLSSDQVPLFGQIRVILISEQKAHFVLELLDVIQFDEHFYAYETRLSDKWLFVESSTLLSHLPTNIRLLANGKSYVPFRFSVKTLRK